MGRPAVLRIICDIHRHGLNQRKLRLLDEVDQIFLRQVADIIGGNGITWQEFDADVYGALSEPLHKKFVAPASVLVPFIPKPYSGRMLTKEQAEKSILCILRAARDEGAYSEFRVFQPLLFYRAV